MENTYPCQRVNSTRKCLAPEALRPSKLCSNYATHNLEERLPRKCSSSVNDRNTRPLELADRGRLVRSVLEITLIDPWLHLENGVHGLYWNEPMALLIEESWRVLIVVDDYVNLMTRHSEAIQNNARVNRITPWQITPQDFNKTILMDFAKNTRMCNSLSR